MKKNVWIALTTVLVLAFAGIAIVSVVMGSCSGMLELANGNTVFMKCHWTYRVTTMLGVAGALSALYSYTLGTKEGRRTSALTQAILAVSIACVPFFVIGTCAAVGMQCLATKPVVLVLAATALTVAIIEFVKADPEDADKPKAQI